MPQVPPPACAGALHTVDVAGIGATPGTTDDNYAATDFGLDADGQLVKLPSPDAVTGAVVTVPASTPTDNPTFVDIGGSPYEGQQTPICDTKLVPLANGRSIVPTFNVFTDVPLPGRFWGLLVDDLNFSSNKHQINYGEKAGIPFAPVGIYDYTNRLVYTTESDYSGLFDVLLPSTDRISCPTPSGVCPGVYRFVGNDQGSPGALNPNWNPQFRTIAAEFEAFPGVIVPADLAPTQVGVSVQLPGGQAVLVQVPARGNRSAAVRRRHAVRDRQRIVHDQRSRLRRCSRHRRSDARRNVDSCDFVERHHHRGDASTPAVAPGPHQLSIRAGNGRSSVSGLTFHVHGSVRAGAVHSDTGDLQLQQRR